MEEGTTRVLGDEAEGSTDQLMAEGLLNHVKGVCWKCFYPGREEPGHGFFESKNTNKNSKKKKKNPPPVLNILFAFYFSLRSDNFHASVK